MANSMDSAQLKQLDRLFNKYCTPEWRDLARQNVTTLNYKAGEKIFKEGQKAEYMYMINVGRVKVYTNYADDVEVIIRFATDGQTLGHRGLGEDFVFPISAVALTDSSVNLLPMKIFQNLLKANNMFCYYFLMFFTEELRRSERRKKKLLNMTVKQRVANAVSMNADCFGFEKDDMALLSYTISRKDIASLASTSYESVIRSLSELQAENILKLEGKRIRILDMQGLGNIML